MVEARELTGVGGIERLKGFPWVAIEFEVISEG